jgi:hypothetical protein
MAFDVVTTNAVTNIRFLRLDKTYLFIVLYFVFYSIKTFPHSIFASAPR